MRGKLVVQRISLHVVVEKIEVCTLDPFSKRKITKRIFIKCRKIAVEILKLNLTNTTGKPHLLLNNQQFVLSQTTDCICVPTDRFCHLESSLLLEIIILNMNVQFSLVVNVSSKNIAVKMRCHDYLL